MAIQTHDTLISDLAQGLDDGAFEPVFQPIARLSDGALAGFEALARWRRGAGPLTEPAAFMEAALHGDLLGRISRAILITACGVASAWQGAGCRGLFVSVNVAGRDLENPNFAAEVLAVVRAANLQPAALKVELTEQQALREPALAARQIMCLRSEGVRILFDDFGSGFNSLSWLIRLPADAIKFDHALISLIDRDVAAVKVVRAMTALAHDLGLEVVAEGVESAEQRDMLADLGCDLAQGHFYAPPLATEAAGELIVRVGRGAV